MTDEPIYLKQAGAIWWHSDDYHSPNLSKTSLGTFFHHVLKEGGHIGNIWVFDRTYHRSGVYVSVFMTEAMKEKIESETKFKFRLPPKVKFNDGRDVNSS